jgi:hypothetical protein
MADVKPQWPPCSGRQYAADSMTPEELSVSYDQYNNEVASDRPMHTDTTPGNGSFSFGSPQYSDDFAGGWKPYGVEVASVAPSRENVTVNSQSTERGKES